jgi:hypothetical protein
MLSCAVAYHGDFGNAIEFYGKTRPPDKPPALSRLAGALDDVISMLDDQAIRARLSERKADDWLRAKRESIEELREHVVRESALKRPAHAPRKDPRRRIIKELWDYWVALGKPPPTTTFNDGEPANPGARFIAAVMREVLGPHDATGLREAIREEGLRRRGKRRRRSGLSRPPER